MAYRILSSLVGVLLAQMLFFAGFAIALSEEDLARLDIIKSCTYCDLTYAHLMEADLSDANLTGANLNNADLSRANLVNADLRGATLVETNLENANLTGANLANADFSRANLSGADFTNADLSFTVWADGKRCKKGSMGKCGR